MKIREKKFELDGFPDAEKAITFQGQKLKRLSHLWLHHLDLEFAGTCLQELNTSEPIKATISEALWRSSLVHYFKCFGTSSSRSPLNPQKVLRGKKNGLAVHQQLKALRDKHIVHDENPFSSVSAGVIINQANIPQKIARVICVSNHLQTLNQETWNNLRLLIENVNTWVVSQFDELAETLTKELEAKDRDELLAMKSMTIEVCSWDSVSMPR